MPLKNVKVFYGWWIVGILVLISAYFVGILFFGFTALIEPIIAEFGWSYAQVSFAMSLRAMEMGLLAPVVGLLIDRFGSRKLLVSGIVLCGLGLFALSRITSLVQLYVVFFVVASGATACTGVIPMTVVGNWFRKKVSVATGIVLSGNAVGGLLVPLLTIAIDTLGWRMAMVAIAVIAWIVFLPLSFLVRHSPEPYGYVPDGTIDIETAPNEDQSLIQDNETSISVRQSLKSRAFWQISFTFIFHMLVTGAVVTHVMPYLNSIGIARSTSSFIASGIPLMTIVGRFGFGWFGDKYDKRWITALAFLLLGSGLVIFNYISSTELWLLVIFLVIFGIGYGGPVTMLPALVREYFGRVKLGTIIGLVLGIGTIGSLAGPPLAGWIYDSLGSYHTAWYVLAAVSVAGIFCIATTPSFKILRQKAVFLDQSK
jgi:sugar phosphate permease